MLRAANVRDGELDTADMVFVARDILSKGRKGFDASFIQEGDILITRTGAKAGETCVVPHLAREFIISSHSIRVVPNKTAIEPKYLERFLLSIWGKVQINRLFTGAAQKQLQLATIAEIQVAVPPMSEQLRLVSTMDAAGAARQAKLAEAEELLAGLDDFLLDTLGLIPPPKDDRRVFAVRRVDAQNEGHLNSDYFHPERILALRSLTSVTAHLDCCRLAEAVDFIREPIKTPSSNYLSLAHVQSNTGELMASNEEVSGSCAVFKTGDVLFARLRPYLNKVYRAEFDGCCSPEFHVLRVRNISSLQPDYLAAILRSNLILAQTRHMMTGNTHPRLTNEDVVNLVIPVPKPKVQNKVVAEVCRRRETARSLRTEAEADWQAAKQWFEEQLLGGRSLS